LGVGALIVARVWLPQPSHPAAGTAAQVAADTVPVVVASADIPYGTKLDAGRLTVERLPPNAAPKGAFATTSQVLSQSGGAPIALTPIAAREPILPSKLSGGGAKPTVAAVIGEGMRAYTIGISDVAGVGGHALPGDRVDVVLTRTLPKKANDPSLDKQIVSDIVLQDVRLLGMDLNADPSTTQAVVAHTATVEVSVADAQKLSVAAQTGLLTLALRRTGNADVAPVHTVKLTDVLAGGGASRMPRVIPVAHRGRPQLAPSMIFRTHSVVVVHGDSSSAVVVPAERFGAGA
jgi:pilus assembly protein CpaB